jgi:hypothetical protein
MALEKADLEQINTIIGVAITAAATETAKQVGALTTRLDEAAKGALTAEAVKAQIAEALTAERTAAATQAAEKVKADEAAATARTAFIAVNAGKLPAAYQALIPASADEAALKAGLEKANEQLKADLASGKYAMQAQSLGADAPNKPGNAGDVDKLSPTQKIAAGMAEKATAGK